MKNETKQRQRLQIGNIIALVAVVVVNILASALPLNGRATGEISDALPSFITPAGYTFSIWGVIYLALLGFAIYQALPAQRDKLFLVQIGWLFVASSVFNIGWLFAWHYGFYLLSIVAMALLLLTLITIFVRLRIGRPDPSLPLVTRLLVHVPFSIYLGWITVATIVNVASVVNDLGWNGFGISEPVWSAIMMGVAVIVAAGVLLNRRAVAYAAVLIWALIGIRNAYPDVAVVANTALGAAVVIVLLAALGYWRAQRQATEQPRMA